VQQSFNAALRYAPSADGLLLPLEHSPAENKGMDAELDMVERGIGQICIGASSLEWSMAYCASVILSQSDAWFIKVYARPGGARDEFRKLVHAVAASFPEQRAEVEGLCIAAEGLLNRRNRVVHSVVASERDVDSRFIDAWHAKTDAVWPIDPRELRSLADDLALCAARIDAFGAAWEDGAERRGWPEA
jgi:hypothetical protein